MHFELVHEFDIPLDALELAVISPNLADRLSTRLSSIEAIHQRSHAMTSDRLDRVLHFQANVKLPSFAKGVLTKEMCAWNEETAYDLRSHRARWSISLPNVKPEWRQKFHAEGTYTLVSLGEDKTKRVVEGHIELAVPVVKRVAERMIVSEVKKTFDAEAQTLRELATLI